MNSQLEAKQSWTGSDLPGEERAELHGNDGGEAAADGAHLYRELLQPAPQRFTSKMEAQHQGSMRR